MALEFPRDLKQFCGISKGGAFCLEFPVVKLKKTKTPGGGSKKYVLSTPYLVFFWKILTQLLQNCFISSKLLFQDLKFDIVCDDNGVSLQKIVVYMKCQKEVPVVVANGPFYPNFAPIFEILHVEYI